jgi:hypothetical protein
MRVLLFGLPRTNFVIARIYFSRVHMRRSILLGLFMTGGGAELKQPLYRNVSSKNISDILTKTTALPIDDTIYRNRVFQRSISTPPWSLPKSLTFPMMPTGIGGNETRLGCITSRNTTLSKSHSPSNKTGPFPTTITSPPVVLSGLNSSVGMISPRKSCC